MHASHLQGPVDASDHRRALPHQQNILLRWWLGCSWGIPFTDADIEDAELFASMVVDTFEAFTARTAARKAILALWAGRALG